MPTPKAGLADTLHKLVMRSKEGRRAWFCAQLAELDVAGPDGLATQLTLLVDGGIATMLVRGNQRIVTAALDAAAVLLLLRAGPFDGFHSKARRCQRPAWCSSISTATR